MGDEQGQERGLNGPLEILTGVRGVVGGLIATEDGLPVAVRLQSQQDSDLLSAAAAAIGRLARKTTDRLERGEFEIGVFDAPRYRFLVQPLSVGFLLVLAEPQANVGLISAEMTSTAAALDAAAAEIGGN